MFGNRAQMQSMMKKARKMQEEMKKLQDEIKKKTVDVTVGGGAVSVVLLAAQRNERAITSLKIAKDAIDPNDSDMLEDLLITAINEASRKVDDMVSNDMGKITGGLGLPGGLF